MLEDRFTRFRFSAVSCGDRDPAILGDRFTYMMPG